MFLMLDARRATDDAFPNGKCAPSGNEHWIMNNEQWPAGASFRRSPFRCVARRSAAGRIPFPTEIISGNGEAFPTEIFGRE